MESTVDRSVSEPADSSAVVAAGTDHSVDVPGMLAARIGTMWAAEERTRRQERTHRMIVKAQELQE